MYTMYISIVDGGRKPSYKPGTTTRRFETTRDFYQQQILDVWPNQKTGILVGPILIPMGFE